MISDRIKRVAFIKTIGTKTEYRYNSDNCLSHDARCGCDFFYVKNLARVSKITYFVWSSNKFLGFF